MDGAEIALEVPDSFAPLFNQVFGDGQMPEETLQPAMNQTTVD
jgi:hypothetical protein